MGTVQPNDIFTLLALMIFADKRVLSEEIDTFLRVSSDLQDKLEVNPKVSGPRLLMWFSSNRDNISHFMHAPDFETQLTALLSRLAPLPDKQPILYAMHTIAKANDKLHVREHALTVLAKRAWS